MKTRIALRVVWPALACAAAYCATEVWNTKDPAVWTTEDANLILNNSPWAKQIKVGGQQMGQRRGMGRRGGMGYPGGGYPGGGYPGGGYPGGGGRGGQGGGAGMPMSALIRWESAQPVQQAEARLKSLNTSSDAAKPETPKASDHYIVSVIGLRAQGSRYRNNDDDSDRRSSSSTQARDQLMTYTQLVIKNKAPIGPDDVKIDNQSGQNEIRFFFPKTNPITAADKEVTFQTMVGSQKVENKFELKKMTRNGKLELD